MRRAFMLIHNPLAGRRGNRLTHRVIAALEVCGAEICEINESKISTAQSKAATSLDSQTFDAVLIAGGDGTVRAMAPLLMKYDIPVGLVPAGTGNVLAHETGQKVNIDKLVQSFMTGPEIQIQSSHANSRTFFLMAGVGFDGDIIARLDTATKQRFGKAAYLWPLVRALMKKPQKLTVEIDAVTYGASWVVATRARHYAGAFILDKTADLCGSLMTAILFKSKSRRGRFLEALALATNQLDRMRTVQKIPCSKLQVTAKTPVAAQADGDAIASTPLEISTGHAPLRLIVSENFANETML